MSGAMKLAMTFTAIDAASSILLGIEKKILRLGDDAKHVQKAYREMVSEFRTGLKAFAATKYILETAYTKGVKPAADLQEAMTNVKMNIASSAASAEELNNWLKQVEATSIKVAKNQPFKAEEIASTANELLKAGIKIQDVVGEKGAAFAAGGLSALSGMDPAATALQMGKVSEQYNIKGGEQFKEFADWMTKVDDATSTKIPELFYGLKRAGTEMQALHISVKDSITALGVLSPLADEAGTALGRMVERMAGTTPQSRKEMKKLGLKFFKNGKFIGLGPALDQIQDKFSKMEDQEEMIRSIHKIFQEEGGRAVEAFINLYRNTGKRFSDMTNEYGQGLDIESKLKIRKESFNASKKDLSTTIDTTKGILFKPVLEPLSNISNSINETIGGIQDSAQNNTAIPKVVAGGTAALAFSAMALATYKMLKGLKAARTVFRGLFGGAASTALGVAEGKVLEKVAGVTPVFVTNWPSGGAGGTLPSAPTEKPTILDKWGKPIATGIGDTPSELKEVGEKAKWFAPLAGATVPTAIAAAIASFGMYLSHLGYQMAPAEAGAGPTWGDIDGTSWVDQHDVQIAQAIEKVKPEVNVRMNVFVDQFGRVVTETSDLNLKADVSVQLNRGEFFEAAQPAPSK